MKRLLSLLLVIAMLFGVCTVFTACDNASVSDEEDDGDKKKEEKKDTFQGLEIGLPKSFKKGDSSKYSITYNNDKYDVHITYSENEWGESAKNYWKDYKEQVNEAVDEGYFEDGKADKTDKGTYYIYGVLADEPYAIAIAFYTTDNSYWQVQIRNNEENENFDVEQMVKYITDWKYSDPKIEDDEDDDNGDDDYNDDYNDDIGEGNDATAAPAPDQGEVEEVSGEVIYDYMGIVVKWCGMDNDGYYTRIQLHVENNSGYAIELYGKDFILNYSASFPAYLFCFLSDGESAYCSIDLINYEMERFGAELVGALDFTLQINNAYDYQTMDESAVSIRTQHDGYYNDNYGAGYVLFDENNVRVLLQGIQLDGEYESYLWLYIENYSDQAVSLCMSDVHAMGWFLTDATVFERVMPGTYTIAALDISELYKLGLESPEQLENLSAYVYTMDDEYNTIASNDASYCPGDPDAVLDVEITGSVLHSGEGLDIVLVDVIEDEYYVEFKFYFRSTWDTTIRTHINITELNGHVVDDMIGIYLLPGMQHMGSLCLWYDEYYDFTCLEDLTSLKAFLDAYDYGYYVLVNQEIEMPLN